MPKDKQIERLQKALEDCPFCGSDDVHAIKRRSENVHPYWTGCKACGAGTSHHGDWLQSVKAWNTRALDTIDRLSEPVAAMGIEGSVLVETERGPVDVDASLAPLVDALNRAGLATIASCSGHGHRPGNIALRDGREIIIARNYEEARQIDRLSPIGANGEPVPASEPVGEDVVERACKAFISKACELTETDAEHSWSEFMADEKGSTDFRACISAALSALPARSEGLCQPVSDMETELPGADGFLVVYHGTGAFASTNGDRSLGAIPAFVATQSSRKSISTEGFNPGESQ